MDGLNVLIAIGLIHCSLFFFDTFFRSCSHYPYLYFLKNTGLEIQVLRVKWFTTAFNRTIVRWGMERSRFWSAWFNAGVIISIILLPVALFLVVKTTIDAWFNGSSGSESVHVLEPMLPGVNLPLNEIGYYAITFAVCSIVHELGHALAAAREDVQLFGLGLQVAFIIPFAFTYISSEQLATLPVRNQLRVLCAGIWHNIVLAIGAAITLILTTFLWSPLFTVGQGVSVKAISPNSPLLGPSGLLHQDTIYQLNHCSIEDGNDWYNCILEAIRQPTPGYCIAQYLIQEHDETVPARQTSNSAINCCSADSEVRGSLCFEYIEGPQAAPLQLPLHSCLPARVIVEGSQRFCQMNFHCTPRDTHCMRPSLDNITKVVQIKRRNGKDVLFFGYPGDISRTVDVSDWIPKYSFLSSELPESLALLCKYITVFSAGLAIVNVVPCFYSDGQNITTTLTQYLLRSRVRHKSVRHAIALTITCAGTVLLGVSLVYALVNKLL
ncbi:membrane-bound transcription factor site-2 protease [Cephus cinctus]|uniref:Membrane-bound transcription factor site-2 protease n=1 Tax=Cephus cinctus TaxID=211228 RepID=A0AAJ7FRK0_CEPCN|nr:membrane-bound transcription factor site-2 protease [Cephus cinctus]